MSYSPPTGNVVNLVFSGPKSPPLQNGGSIILAFSLSAAISSTQLQTMSGLGSTVTGEITGAGVTGQSQSIIAIGNASRWITSVQGLTGQSNETAQLIAIYVAPSGNNLIIDLGTGAYSPPLASNVIIDLGDTIGNTNTYTKFLMFLNDTFMV